MNPKVQLMLQQAIKAFEGRNFDGADLILQEVLQKDINSADLILELGIAYAKVNRFKEASAVFCCLQTHKNDDVRIPYNLGLIHSLQGEHQLALAAYDLALEIKPDDVDALVNKGSTCNDIKNYVLALEVLEKAIQLRPDTPEAWSNKGIALNCLNSYQESINAYNEAINLNPNYHEAWSNKSVPLNKLKRFLEAFDACERALILEPDYAEAWSNKGITLNELKRHDEAIAHYDKALSLKPDYAEGWSNKGVTLNELKRFKEALAHYDRALTLEPDYAEAWTNKGVTLHELKRHEEAITHYDKALTLKPDFVEAWTNKGVTLHELKRHEEAITHYDKALTLKPDYADAWSNKGILLNELRRHDEAITHFVKALSLKPNIDWLYGDLLHAKMQICSWIGLADSLESLSKRVMVGEKVSLPFQLLALNDDALLHKKSSEIYIQSKHPLNTVLGNIPRLSRNKKIRIGYFSADFKNHPVAYLIAELFELHDKSKFELYAFSLVNVCDAMSARIQKSFDHFIDIDGLSDVAAAKLARDKSIDIAVDLSGLTKDSRTGIFAYRAAPIQINYLGYPGTMGANYIDYIVADNILIPPESQSHYSEKVVYLPNSYQVNDRKRLISDRLFTREELGLPCDGFVFCCFNNNYKILPQTFDSWMRILKGVDGSILWLFQESPRVVDNLKKEAGKQGIEPQRIVFAGRMPLSEHLARYRHANLFLDTLPYNAHTTASDALWAGLPVLTLQGQSFSGRVAASLLNAIHLPELITKTQKEYETLAIDLAKNCQKLASIKQKLENNRLTTPLFDTLLFARHLEVAYLKMVERYDLGLEPDHITNI